MVYIGLYWPRKERRERMDNSNNIDINANEAAFQEALANFVKTNDKRYWNEMWFCMQKACANITKFIYKSRDVIVPDEVLEDVITDATAYCMKMIKQKGYRPTKLSSYVYLRCVCFINDKKDMAYNEHIVDMSAEDFLLYKDKIGEE